MKRKSILFAIAIFIVSIMATGCIKVIKIGEEGKYTGKTEFNAGDNVAEFWESLALPEIDEKAIDLKEFLTEAKGDVTSLADKYGKYSMGDSGEVNYIVKGTAVVKEVVTSSKAGYMVVELEDYSGKKEIVIQIGTVFKGTSVRDSLSFIKFGDYTNQQEYAAVSQSINKLVQETVIDKVDLDSLTGKTIEFKGCFTATSNEKIVITPTYLGRS